MVYSLVILVKCLSLDFRCAILPHIGSATFETRVEMARLAAENALTAIFDEEMPAALDLSPYQG